MSRPLGPAVLLAGVVLVAVNLRPVITAVGPVLPQVGAGTGLGATALGALGAVPVLAFAVVSPLVHPLVRRFGVERTVLGALVVLALGTVLRSLPGPTANLWAGTALIGATVAVGNVALPVVVKKDFPFRVPRTTGTYVAAQSVFAALASGLAVPLAAVGTWRLSLGVWVSTAVLAVVVWLPRVRRTPGGAAPGAASRPAAAAAGGDPDRPDADAGHARVARHRSVWASPLAWQVAAYMGLQSTPFYVLITWLPSLEQDLGVTPAVAGWHLFVYQAVAIVSNLVAPTIMHVRGDQRFATVAVPAVMVASTLGLAVVPQLLLVWVALMGLSSGAAFVVTLSLVGMRSLDPHTASQLSAMSQAVGYAFAGSCLVLAGVLRDLTGPGPLLLVFLAGIATAQLLVGLRVGRHRVLHVPH